MRYTTLVPKTPSTSLRLSAEARQIIKRMAEKLGVSRTAVVELAIREFQGRKEK